MRKLSLTSVFSAMFILILAVTSNASQDTIGPNGIESSSLGLTGAGIRIGQVEPGRSGKASVPPGDDATHSNTTILPTAVFLLNGPAVVNQNILTDNAHAERVAGVLISTDAVRTGVATQAELYSSSDGDTGPAFDANSALTAQHLINESGGVRAINMSFGNELEGSHILDGNSLLTLFVDWSASQHDVLYVVAGNEDVGGLPIPTDNYNGMTVAGSKKNGSVYREASDLNNYVEDAIGLRTSVDLLAPGDDVDMTTIGNNVVLDNSNDGTSFAAPHVTGTVALLQQYAVNNFAANQNARRHEVMKAVLMNSADKLEDAGDGLRLGMTRTVLDQSGNDWLSSEAYTGAMSDERPLDDQMGAGHLNAKRAVQQFGAGEHEFGAGPVPLVGWDYGFTDGQDEFNKYVLDSPLPANQFVSLTLAWDRDVFFEVDDGTPGAYDIGDTFLEFAEPIDLNLYLMPAGQTDVGLAAARSIATDTSVEHIFFEIATPGMYEIWVGQDSGGFSQQLYALAWWMEAIINPASTGDYSGNGTVGPEDYTIWKLNFGTANAAADGNGNGIVDAADYTVWRDNLGAGSGSLASVPEPTTAWLMMVGLAGFAGLRRKSEK